MRLLPVGWPARAEEEKCERVDSAKNRSSPILKESEAGVETGKLCRRHGITKGCFYRWKGKFGGMVARWMKNPVVLLCVGSWTAGFFVHCY
jgi:hypothetical protein